MRWPAVLVALEAKQKAAKKEYAPKMAGSRKCTFVGEPSGTTTSRTFYQGARIDDLEVLRRS